MMEMVEEVEWQTHLYTSTHIFFAAPAQHVSHKRRAGINYTPTKSGMNKLVARCAKKSVLGVCVYVYIIHVY